MFYQYPSIQREYSFFFFFFEKGESKNLRSCGVIVFQSTMNVVFRHLVTEKQLFAQNNKTNQLDAFLLIIKNCETCSMLCLKHNQVFGWGHTSHISAIEEYKEQCLPLLKTGSTFCHPILCYCSRSFLCLSFP